MYTKEEICKFKDDLKENILTWAEDKIDALCASRPKLKPASIYLKRGLNNWMKREDARIGGIVDNVMLFVTDENGGIDTDLIIDDLISMFKDMEVQQIAVGNFLVEYGGGEVVIHIPHHPLLDIIFGDLGQIRITSEDFTEMKELFTENTTAS